MAPETLFYIQPPFFEGKEGKLVESGALSATAFRFNSGVCGLRLANGLGELVMLPFQGQQIWSAAFGGRELAMKSMFDQPRPTRAYLETYGAFLLHCGITAMGVPTKVDSHPLHGELPNAPYQAAYVVIGQDERGSYIGLGGRFQYTVAFGHNYIAHPLVKLYADSRRFRVTLTVMNLKSSEMELMYLAHINFRPVDDGRLMYSAPCTPQNVRVRTSIPSHVQPQPGYEAFLDELARHPEKHNYLAPDLPFDPEVVLYVDYRADRDGWAHSMQVHPDGSADYVRHRPDQLEKGVRWISRTPDQDALGLILPATAEPEGYTAEKAKGNLKTLPPNGLFQCDLEIGVLTPDETAQMERRISRILETESNRGGNNA